MALLSMSSVFSNGYIHQYTDGTAFYSYLFQSNEYRALLYSPLVYIYISIKNQESFIFAALLLLLFSICIYISRC